MELYDYYLTEEEMNNEFRYSYFELPPILKYSKLVSIPRYKEFGYRCRLNNPLSFFDEIIESNIELFDQAIGSNEAYIKGSKFFRNGFIEYVFHRDYECLLDVAIDTFNVIVAAKEGKIANELERYSIIGVNPFALSDKPACEGREPIYKSTAQLVNDLLLGQTILAPKNDTIKWLNWLFNDTFNYFHLKDYKITVREVECGSNMIAVIKDERSFYMDDINMIALEDFAFDQGIIWLFSEKSPTVFNTTFYNEIRHFIEFFYQSFTSGNIQKLLENKKSSFDFDSSIKGFLDSFMKEFYVEIHAEPHINEETSDPVYYVSYFYDKIRGQIENYLDCEIDRYYYNLKNFLTDLYQYAEEFVVNINNIGMLQFCSYLLEGIAHCEEISFKEDTIHLLVKNFPINNRNNHNDKSIVDYLINPSLIELKINNNLDPIILDVRKTYNGENSFEMIEAIKRRLTDYLQFNEERYEYIEEILSKGIDLYFKDDLTECEIDFDEAVVITNSQIKRST